MQVPAPPFSLLCCTGGQSLGWLSLFPDTLICSFWLGFSWLIWAPFHLVQPSQLGWSPCPPLLFCGRLHAGAVSSAVVGICIFFCFPFSSMSCSWALEKMVGGTSSGSQLLKGPVSRLSWWRGGGKITVGHSVFFLKPGPPAMMCLV